MFRNDIWRYGAVDVKDANGLVRHGMVIDVHRPHGLIVDFGYPAHHADLIPFASFVQGRLPAGQPPPGVGGPAQVLYQLSAHHPWCWHPATLLAGGAEYAYAFVEIRLEEGSTVRDVVGWGRVQAPGGMPAWGWEKDSSTMPFKRCCVDLGRAGDPHPAMDALMRRADFAQEWQRVTETIVVRVVGRQVTCLATSVEIPRLITEETFLTRMGILNLERGRKRGRNGECDCRSKRRKGASSPRVVRHSTTCLPTTEPTQEQTTATPADTTGKCYIRRLPVELLSRIFTFLDVNERAAASATCYTWNSVIKSPQLARRLEIDANKCSGAMLAHVMHALVTPSTKTLVVTNLHTERGWFSCPLHIMADILHAKKMKLPRIIVARSRIYLRFALGSERWRPEMATRWAAVCDNLVLEDVTVALSWLDSKSLLTVDMLDDFQWMMDLWVITNHRIRHKIINTQTKNRLAVADIVDTAKLEAQPLTTNLHTEQRRKIKTKNG
ncbi:uncharacterized protein LOC129589900 [Paramacrobiotus metropolitanus]|uniref:uncharacterized protein LOC129589900 n=1 Tax=Paramacrobiotus metropolitanus TaxID=2943436 RepID=UPI002445EF6B|nr:uncharacterized protein LOC129589900 [Paramacrobiotus metropolitanus]